MRAVVDPAAPVVRTRPVPPALARFVNAFVGEPTPPPVIAPSGSPVPTRAVPCTDEPGPFTVHAAEGHPIVCSERRCLQLDLDRDAAIVVKRPAPTVPMPASASVEQRDGRWWACRGDTCKRLGAHLARALDHAAEPHAATLDLAAVVIGADIWNVATDRIVTLVRPEIRPWGPEREVTIIGDLMVVGWKGDCTDMRCFASQLVDRTGRTVDWVDVSGRVLRVDDRRFVTVSGFSKIEIRDLHRGTLINTLDPHSRHGDFLDITRLDDNHFALLRDAGDGFDLQELEIWDSDLKADNDRRMVVRACE